MDAAKGKQFHDLFAKMLAHYFPDESTCYLAGVRSEESPSRHGAVTIGATYKHITYGKVLSKTKDHYTFYPIYDWCLSDVWKAIYDNDWPYCKIYDEMYRYGVQPRDMRVSNLHHETAVHSLFFLSEVEPDTWDALTKRLAGINQAKHIQKKEMLRVDTLPLMFESWEEYRDYLTDSLITDPKHRSIFHKKWLRMDALYGDMIDPSVVVKQQIRSLLVNDWEFVKISSFLNSPPIVVYRQWKEGKLGDRHRPSRNLIHIKPEHLNESRASS